MRDRADIPEEVVDAVAETVCRILDDDFGGREKWGAQRAAEGPLGISQTQISDLKNGKAGKLGLGTILALRDYLKSKGRPYSLDVICGFASPFDEIAAELERVRSKLDAARATASPPQAPAPKPARRARRKKDSSPPASVPRGTGTHGGSG